MVSENSLSPMTMSDDGKVPKSDHWCRTTSGETTVTTFTWTIEDFESRPEKTGEKMCSSTFLAKKPNRKDSMWQLALYPKGFKEDTYLSIYLENRNEFQMKAKFRVSILDSNSRKSKSWGTDIHLYEAMKSSNDWGAEKWNLREPLIKNKYMLPGGHLSIHCELTVYGNEKISSGSGCWDYEDTSKTIRKAG